MNPTQRASPMSNVESVFRALGDTHRRELLFHIAETGAQSATQLSDSFEMTRQGVSKHLGILQDAGLVETRKQGRDKLYILTPEPLYQATSWISLLNRTWETRLARLKHLVENEENA